MFTKSLDSIMKPFSKMKTDLELFIKAQDAKGDKIHGKADDLRKEGNACYDLADQARENLNVVNALLPKEEDK